MAMQSVEEILEKKVAGLRKDEKAKKEELAEIQKELRRYETALESLKKDIPDSFLSPLIFLPDFVGIAFSHYTCGSS